MTQEETKKKVLNRLKTIKGHIGGIEKMILDNKECEEIILQIGAIKGSISKVGLLILENYAKECLVPEDSMSDEETERLSKAIRMILDFSK